MPIDPEITSEKDKENYRGIKKIFEHLIHKFEQWLFIHIFQQVIALKIV
jgi:hypothetical protein